MSEHYNLVVLGAGPGGYVAALKAGQLGASVALIEKHHLGGTCLNYGCIPSKAILASSELIHKVSHAGDMGIDISGTITPNWGKIQQRKDRVLAMLRSGIKSLLGSRKVRLFEGSAAIDGAGKIVIDANGNKQPITADKIIVATGSVPSRIPGWPTDPTKVCTSDEALHWKSLPSSLLIVGGGVIGCEFACMMQPLGVQVTIVEMLPRILPNLDEQFAEQLTKTFSKRGINIFTGVKIVDLKSVDEGIVATLDNGQTISASIALVATGRKPNTAGIGLESIGLATNRGFIPVNDKLETDVKDVYCIGDANGRCLLAHSASAQAIIAAENALGQDKTDHAPIPICVYTFPEIGSVGLTATEARERNIPISIGQFNLAGLGKAMAANDREGFVKFVRNRETDEILGIHMMGHNATECIAAAGVLLHQKVKTHDAADLIFAHPTMSESIKESLEDSIGEGIHAPPRKVIRASV